MAEQEIIKECKEGKSYWVCFDCAAIHREKDTYDGTITCHMGKCAICEQKTTVSSSRKLFGLHKFI